MLCKKGLDLHQMITIPSDCWHGDKFTVHEHYNSSVLKYIGGHRLDPYNLNRPCT